LYLLAVAIASLVAGIVYLATQTTFFQDTWEALTDAMATAWNWLWDNALKPVFNAIETAFKFLLDGVVAPVMSVIFLFIGLFAALFEALYENAIAPVLDNIAIGFEALVDNVIEPAAGFMQKAFQAIGTTLKSVWDSFIKPAIGAIGDAFKFVQEKIIDPIGKAISTTVENLGKTFRDVFQGVSDFMRNIFNGLVAIVKTPLNSIISMINGTIRGLNSISIKIPDWVPQWGGKDFGINIPQIPQLADGGIVMPRPGGVLANLAEAGKPEAVIPLDRMGSMGGQQTFNITVNAGVGADGNRIGEQIVNEILRFERASGRVFARA
jgi:hypothetical protein